MTKRSVCLLSLALICPSSSSFTCLSLSPAWQSQALATRALGVQRSFVGQETVAVMAVRNDVVGSPVTAERTTAQSLLSMYLSGDPKQRETFHDSAIRHQLAW